MLVDSLGFEAEMAGLQGVVRDVYTNSDNQGMLSIMQVGTDVAIPGQVQGIEVPYYNYAQLTSQDGGASYFWGQAYRIINNANVIIAASATAPATLRQGYKNRIAAEARFYRAYAYDLLATLYGDVPLIDQPLTAPRTDFTRTPVATVNDFIVTDLTTAIPNLYTASKLVAAQSGRITQGAAQHLLGQVYLRMNQPAKAETVLQTLLSSSQYKLISARYGVNAAQPGRLLRRYVYRGQPAPHAGQYGNHLEHRAAAERARRHRCQRPAAPRVGAGLLQHQGHAHRRLAGRARRGPHAPQQLGGLPAVHEQRQH